MKNALMLLDTRQQSDPRIELEPETLALAKRNAFPIVAQRTSKKDGMGLVVGAGAALLLGAATFLGMSGSRSVQPAKPHPASVPLPEAKPAAVVLPPQAMTPVVPGTEIAAAPGVGIAPIAPAIGDPAAVAQQFIPNAGINRHGAPALILDSGPGNSTSAGIATGLSNDEAFAARVGNSGPEVAKATRMKNPGQTVSQGTLIPAVLETAINSDLPGYVRAVVSSDIRSFDGSRVLVPRSSRLIGQYKSGVAGGQTRAYVLWTRLIRPDGVSVALGSPAVDEAGQTGLSGSVNSHFMKRFGSALLLSVVGTASSLASGGAGLILSGGESAASVAAQRDGQIAPTIKVRQGQPIRVFTAKDLDFSTVAG
ncbi:MAG: type VI secretion protein [Sphingomonas sp.]|nr:type VI secretion protein [Sphingomonas sp.]